jgi:hypothetical protein
MKSHSGYRVAFLPLHIINLPLSVQRVINQEKWRFTWYGLDKEAINRPTENEAIANIFLDERGIRHRE